MTRRCLRLYLHPLCRLEHSVNDKRLNCHTLVIIIQGPNKREEPVPPKSQGLKPRRVTQICNYGVTAMEVAVPGTEYV